GRVPRPGEGRPQLRPEHRDTVPGVRRSDHQGRGETVLPRLFVDGPDPASPAGTAGTIASARPQLVQELHRDPSLQEIADEIGADVNEVEAAIAADGCFSVLSLDRPVDGDSTANLADTIADEEDTSFEQTEAVAVLEPVLSDLAPRERRILE